VSTTPGGSPVNITSSLPANELCFGYHHAILARNTSNPGYEYLLAIKKNTSPTPHVLSENITLRDLTFDGEGHAGDNKGSLVFFNETLGTQNLIGVHVQNNRGTRIQQE
jgi:hypothetical protein